MVVAAPAVAVAVNVTGLPVRPMAVAVNVLLFAPAPVPSVQPICAKPDAPVATGFVPLSDPPPAVTANVTDTPATGLLKASRTTTRGAIATAVFTVAVCPLPVLTAIWVAAPVLALAVNVTGLPLSPAAVAKSVLLFVPAVVPSVQLITCAIPDAFVVIGVSGFTLPPPAVTANVTLT